MSDPAPTPIVFPIRVLRPDDLAVITFRFHNILLMPRSDDRPPRLFPKGSDDDPPVLVLDLPPQAVSEQSFPSQSQDPTRVPVTTGEVIARLSSPGRIVFTLEPEGLPIPYTLEGLLAACRGSSPRVVKDEVFTAEPLTAFELPYGLFVAPVAESRFRHEVNPVFSDAGAGTTAELWHTRLTALDETNPGPTQIRAVAAFDRVDDRPDDGSENDPALTRSVRDGLVVRGTKDVPVEVETLLLTALGGWLNADGRWTNLIDPPPGSTDGGTSVMSWRHRSTMGRDHFVEAATLGYLYPLGHKALNVTITERRLEAGADAPDPVVAGFLRTRQFIVVLERQKDYAHGDLPFRSARIVTTVTPDLLAGPIKDTTTKEDITTNGSFWPLIAEDQDYLFHAVLTDHAGATTDLAIPLAFIDAIDVPGQGPESGTGSLGAWMFPNRRAEPPTGFLAEKSERRRVWAMGGRRITFVPERGGAPAASDTTYETAAIQPTAEFVDAPGDAPFRPSLFRARAVVPALREISGSAEPVSFSYHRRDFDGPRSRDTPIVPGDHPLDVFAELSDPVNARFKEPGSSSGLATPSFTMQRLSRTLGPLGGTAASNGTANEGEFDPAAFFGDALPKLLGVNLVDLLASTVVPDLDSVIGPNGPVLPRLVSEQKGSDTTTRLQWDATLAHSHAFNNKQEPKLSIDVERTTGAGATTSRVTGTLTNFAIQIPSGPKPLVQLPFTKVSFTAVTNAKPDVGVEFDQANFRFLNELSFVNTLVAVLDAIGLDDPPSVAVSAEGVEVGYSLRVPNVPAGAFNLQNLAISSAFCLPLLGDGSASLKLAFAERHDPCIVTYSAIGGGAYLALELGLGGIETFEGSVEFGGSISIDVGVASGGIALTAGIYFKADLASKQFTLAGFVRLVGALEVLGLVSMSLEFYLQLGYRSGSDPGVVEGSASLTVKVEVLFFEESATMEVHREFSAAGDPTFAEVLPDARLWETYADAFEKES